MQTLHNFSGQPTQSNVFNTNVLRTTNGNSINYCYVLIDTLSRDAIAIDPAWDIESIKGTIEKYHSTLRAIFLTHHHYDHVDLAVPLSRLYGAPIYISKQESDFYGVRFDDMTTFENDLSISVGNFLVEAILTPGHTSGSACYKIGNNLFTGDTLFIEGCGMCSGKGSSASDMYQSLNKLKHIIPGATKVYPGHRYSKQLGAPFSSLVGTNIYLCIDNEDTFIQFRMRKHQHNLFNFI